MRISDWSSDVCSSESHGATFEPHLLFGVILLEQTRQRQVLAVEVAGLLLQRCHDRVRMHEAPVREHEHVLPVVSHRIGGRWVDDDRPVMTELFLQTGMAVVPEGARLLDRALVMRSEEHTSELQSLMRISYAVSRLKKKQNTHNNNLPHNTT